MNAVTRNITALMKKDLMKKFVFLAGPRQVGKTTIAHSIIKSEKGVYLNYDIDEDRVEILKKNYVHNSWVCLDEFHKFKRWKQHIKGVYDKYHNNLHLLLTGSARLDIYQKSGDSLFGRYYLFHLHPLTLGEINNKECPPLLSNVHEIRDSQKGIEELLKFGGFPEPFIVQSEIEHRRWSNARRSLLIKEDLRDISQIQLLSLAEQLMIILPSKIGSIFSYNSLAEDLRISVPTVQTWLEVFQKLYITFKILPYTKSITRSIQKQPKFYLYDWSQVEDTGARFENFIASHLWKAVHVWNDLGEATLDLFYIRDRDGKEVDFVITKERKPWFLVEVKIAEASCSHSLHYFSERLNIPACQIVLQKNIYKKMGNITIVSADQWLGWLP